MNKYNYPIYKLKIKSWIKHWLFTKTTEKKEEGILSEILTGFTFNLLNTVQRKFNIFNLYGNSVQNGEPTPDSPVSINSAGENLNELDTSNSTLSGYLSNQGEITSSTASDTSDYMPVYANSTYQLTYDYVTLKSINARSVCFYNEDKQFLSGTSYTPANKTNTITVAQKGYVRITYDKNCTDIKFIKNGVGFISEKIENAGGTESQIVIIPVQKPMKSMENESIGTVRDYFIKIDSVWYERHLLANILIDGTQGTISKPSTNRFNIDNAITDYLKAYNKINYMSNQYICYSQQGNNAGFDGLISNVNYGLDLSSGSTSYTIRIKDTRYNDINDFKEWLSNNNLQLIYVLATPNDLICTEEQTAILENLPYTYDDETNIYSDDTVSPYLEIQYYEKEGEQNG